MSSEQEAIQLYSSSSDDEEHEKKRSERMAVKEVYGYPLLVMDPQDAASLHDNEDDDNDDDSEEEEKDWSPPRKRPRKYHEVIDISKCRPMPSKR
ncbi:unnamed protein product [Phytophthora lilii]|uniref:Unnamed protein product n=1 Tax=Phytophthora lilii TaxID=2077276 RepID=A0A9W6X5U8_9STRA|nr:unnamed protein product [Phytophthora lilii]